jgi:hypothetical protein
LAREPKTHSFGACFAASAYVKLPQDRRDVMIDRLRGQEKPFGDVGIAQTLRHQSEHLDLARGQARGIVQVRSAGPAGHAADAALVQSASDDACCGPRAQPVQLGQRSSQVGFVPALASASADS